MKTFSYIDPDALFKNDDISQARELHLERHRAVSVEYEFQYEEAFELFHAMPPSTLPILPPGYQWVRSNEKYTVIRDKAATKHELALVLYGPNKDKKPKINYIFQVDGVTVYSFAHTAVEDPELDRRYPSELGANNAFKVPEFNYKRGKKCSKSHMKGHLIDHRDTIVRSRGILSTYDYRNFIPEPPDGEWGKNIRRLKVGEIRAQQGAYAQQCFYPDEPLMTQNETAVPEYTYFSSYSLKYEKEDVYNFRWDDKLSRPNGQKVLKYASENLATSPESAPVVEMYSPDASDRALRRQVRELSRKVSNIVEGNIDSHHPEYDALHTRYAAADFEFESASQKMLAARAAQKQEHPDVAYRFARRSLFFGEKLAEIGSPDICTKEAKKALSKMFKAERENEKMDELKDIFRQLSF